MTAMGIEGWLRKEAGETGGKWASHFLGRYYYQSGHEQSDVGVMGDLCIEIYDQPIAFQFEMFKVGGRARDSKLSGFDPYDNKFDIVEDDFVIDT